MLGKRIMIAGAAAIGAALTGAARQAGEVIGITQAPNLTENGLPLHKRTPRTSGRSYTVAHGKRMAKKARNVKRHKRAARKG